MKSELKAKLLQHLVSKKKDEGFTLIELLVVIIIIGILSAIALPAFLNQANKAKQSEAKQYVGALVRTQQAYYLENTAFTNSFDLLGKPVKSDTTNYEYPMAVANAGATNESVTIDGKSKKAPLKSYQGIVQLAKVTATSEATTEAILCEAKSPGATAVSGASVSSCGANAISVEK